MRRLLFKSVDTLESLKGLTVTEGRLNLNKAFNSFCNLKPINNYNVNDINISIYPNPTGVEYLIINHDFGTKEKPAEIIIYDLYGRVMVNQYLNPVETQEVVSSNIDLSDVVSGIYFLIVKWNEIHFNTIKIIKN
jgi:hypothetical protein